MNGFDICGSVTENNCCSCGEICGDNVDSRTFTYEGETYDQPSKEMVIDGILGAIYGGARMIASPTRCLLIWNVSSREAILK